jgi:hypothetical protein
MISRLVRFKPFPIKYTTTTTTTHKLPPILQKGLQELDMELFEIMEREKQRQRESIVLIPSEVTHVMARGDDLYHNNPDANFQGIYTKILIHTLKLKHNQLTIGKAKCNDRISLLLQ